MTQRQFEFRVGVFVILSSAVAGVMVFQFSELRSLWEPDYEITIHFDAAPGVFPSTPVRRHGVGIGDVREIVVDMQNGGVLVVVDIHERERLRQDARPRLVRSLLGDASIEIAPGHSTEFLAAGSRLNGATSDDPLQVINRMERQMSLTLESFRATSQQWERVGHNLNSLMQTNEGNLQAIIEQTARSLNQLNSTLENMDRTFASANEIFSDPRNQENLKKSLAAIPQLIGETQQTIVAVKQAIQTADRNLTNLSQVTGPLADRSTSIVTKLDSTLGNLDSLTGELSDFASLINREQGSLRKLATDPALYRNLNDSAELLAVLLSNLQPIVRDMRIFSDKIARHPELIGVSGALRGSSGLKDPPATDAQRQSSGRRRTRRQ